MMNRSVLLLIVALIGLASCSVNRDIMYKTPVDFEYDEIPSIDSVDYRITPFDRIRFSLFSNNGYKLIDIVGQGEPGSGNGSNAQAIRQFGLTYLVEDDGRAKLPTLGRIKLSGMTIIEAEQLLEERYAEYYREPFVQLNVTNNRVIISTGEGGTAQVVLINENMTVIEVLARAGGIANRGNASKIKVIRNGNDSKEIYKLDLSTIDGIYEGDMIVQANDIIYVEPNPEIAREVVRDITPILTLITSSIALISILTR